MFLLKFKRDSNCVQIVFVPSDYIKLFSKGDRQIVLFIYKYLLLVVFIYSFCLYVLYVLVFMKVFK